MWTGGEFLGLTGHVDERSEEYDAGDGISAPLQVSAPGSVRTTDGNAERGPYLMRTIPQKCAYGAEIRP